MSVFNFNVVNVMGSTKFKSELLSTAMVLNLNGIDVLMSNVFSHSDKISMSSDRLTLLTIMAKNRIERSDAIFVVCPNGYIGDRDILEIEYAKSLNKPVIYVWGVYKDRDESGNYNCFLTDKDHNFIMGAYMR